MHRPVHDVYYWVIIVYVESACNLCRWIQSLYRQHFYNMSMSLFFIEQEITF